MPGKRAASALTRGKPWAMEACGIRTGSVGRMRRAAVYPSVNCEFCLTIHGMPRFLGYNHAVQEGSSLHHETE